MIHRISLSLILCAALLVSGPVRAQQADEPILGPAVGAESAADYYEKALVAYNLGEVRSAYIYLKNALKEDPLLLPAHLLLGKIYLSLGQGENAEKQLLIADGLGAHRSLIQNSLARSYLMQGKPEQLIDELFPIGTAPEEDAELLALRGEAQLELEQFFDAQRSFTQAWEMNPRSVGAVLGRVQVMLLQGELERARNLATEAVEIAPKHARAWYLKGTLANSAGDYSGALATTPRRPNCCRPICRRRSPASRCCCVYLGRRRPPMWSPRFASCSRMIRARTMSRPLCRCVSATSRRPRRP
jgi:tetratricopeptide (TPR) repeat protein